VSIGCRYIQQFLMTVLFQYDYARGWTVRGSNPDRGKVFFSRLQNVRTGSDPPHCLLLKGYPVSLSGVKRPRSETGHRTPSSAEPKNEWNCTFSPPVCLSGLDGENVYLYSYTVFLAIHEFCFRLAINKKKALVQRQ